MERNFEQVANPFSVISQADPEFDGHRPAESEQETYFERQRKRFEAGEKIWTYSNLSSDGGYAITFTADKITIGAVVVEWDSPDAFDAWTTDPYTGATTDYRTFSSLQVAVDWVESQIEPTVQN